MNFETGFGSGIRWAEWLWRKTPADDSYPAGAYVVGQEGPLHSRHFNNAKNGKGFSLSRTLTAVVNAGRRSPDIPW